MLKRRENGITLNLELKLEKAEKEQEIKKETKSKLNEQRTVTNMLNVNPTISIITFNVNGLNIPIKRQRLIKRMKTKET